MQAELRIKMESPTLAFQHPAADIAQIPPPQPQLQRSAMQRHQARRSGQNFLPKLAPGQVNSNIGPQHSPRTQPTPSASSPSTISTRSPTILQQGGNTPSNLAVLAQPQAQQHLNFSRPSQSRHNHPAYHTTQVFPHTSNPPQRLAQQSAEQGSASVHSGRTSGSRQIMNPPPSARANTAPQSFYPSPFERSVNHLGKLSPECRNRTVFVLG